MPSHARPGSSKAGKPQHARTTSKDDTVSNGKRRGAGQDGIPAKAGKGVLPKLNVRPDENGGAHDDDDEDEWVSSSGAVTPAGMGDDSDASPSSTSPPTIAMGMTPRETMTTTPTHAGMGRRPELPGLRVSQTQSPTPPPPTPPGPGALQRADTAQTLTPLMTPTTTVAGTPESPSLSPRRARTRPPSMHSLAGVYPLARPHPLIRGMSYSATQPLRRKDSASSIGGVQRVTVGRERTESTGKAELGSTLKSYGEGGGGLGGVGGGSGLRSRAPSPTLDVVLPGLRQGEGKKHALIATKELVRGHMSAMAYEDPMGAAMRRIADARARRARCGVP